MQSQDDPGEKLLEALKNEDLPGVERLIDLKQQGANHRIPRVDLDKTLAAACRAGKGANVNNSFGSESPLLTALFKQPEVMSYLLQNGADVNEVEDLYAALHWALALR
ncbi:hypothetical protein PoB_005419100 [Plakobranchus ocellatus]|uniref:Uncharacterized protein n=1 Tax=Plakobranchus ocellatus TaxID=259542 RepID=A0AAV4BWY3_9GAST|nr:hypothetical protein PoB_005419100 [Plakobranchus ocellatus]